MRLKIARWLYLVILILPPAAYGQKLIFNLNNQVSSWGTINFSEPVKYQFGGRYIPTVTISDSLKNNRKVDAEFSLNTYGNAYFTSDNYDTAYGKIKPYRFWIRYSTPRFEVRLGLQKINFGSASMLRPLMWFDKIDIRDPLQLTDGVYGILSRYYFQNNTNIWLWMLYGNDMPMGWDPVPSVKNMPEFGGRLQQPVPAGEIALSYHHRNADFEQWLDTIPNITQTQFPDDKIGLDGKWDVGVGLWAEYSLKHNDPDNMITHEWETYFNLGLDYTFLLGNGLNVITEYFRYKSKTELNARGSDNTYSALSLNYPFGLSNSLTAIVYYNWEPKTWSRFISLQRSYDYWSFYFMAFWNPETYSPTSFAKERSLYAGKGLQVMTVVNF